MAYLSSRRSFLKRVSAAATCLILPSSRIAFSYEANEKVHYAAIGLGKRGSYLAPTFARIGGELVVLCDADQERIGPFAQKFPKGSVYRDFRRMFDECEKSIDAVVIATPDHTHAVISAAAIRRGKHVYCEKPIAHDVREARVLRELAAQKKVATQMGNQGMATDSFRRTLE
ncbi:MAG TPA: Gfo/Idh/MocA family oxidoreductase, partial [Thermogutta sp.]|nr:Gfo/Idh/MocA family oxidoreductase [Thermogutta sp.]